MKIGVIGAGTMGQGIAKAFAQVEATPLLCDIKLEWAENEVWQRSRRATRSWSLGQDDPGKADAIVAALTPGFEGRLCADATQSWRQRSEDMKVKQTTFGELDAICKPECIFVALLLCPLPRSARTSAPVVGMHSAGPASRMKLIEVIWAATLLLRPLRRSRRSHCHRQSPVQVNEAT